MTHQISLLYHVNPATHFKGFVDSHLIQELIVANKKAGKEIPLDYFVLSIDQITPEWNGREFVRQRDWDEPSAGVFQIGVPWAKETVIFRNDWTVLVARVNPNCQMIDRSPEGWITDSGAYVELDARRTRPARKKPA